MSERSGLMKFIEGILGPEWLDTAAKNPEGVIVLLRGLLDKMETTLQHKPHLTKIETEATAHTDQFRSTEDIQRAIAQVAMSAHCTEKEFVRIGAMAVLALDKLKNTP